MNKQETRTVANVIKRLERDNDRCSGQVSAALNDKNLRIYLDTWVLPGLRLLIDEQRTAFDLKLAVDLTS